MSVPSLLAEAERQLSAAGVTAPRADAELLLAHVLGIARGRLLLADPPDTVQDETYQRLVACRASREPLQHLTGRAAFRHVELRVGPGVFIPRPETELLAGWAIDAVRRAGERGMAEPVVVDLCTGAGAIAAALAAEAPAARVHAVELSPAAHAYAEVNLAGTGVDLRLGDAADAFADLDGSVDVVVANPPYIPLEAFEDVDVEARTHDPALALWSGVDGLDMVRVVERAGARLLRPRGVLGCEHADVQGESAPAIFSAAQRWVDVCDHQDLARRPRFTTARSAASPGAGTDGAWHDGRREPSRTDPG